ncbi:MAG: DUF2891 domain-containing protein [Candidatus Aminicenantes bacterium]|nr:DUF2891 domain-containing protein [Candidatus Aminicenantes bacterium]
MMKRVAAAFAAALIFCNLPAPTLMAVEKQEETFTKEMASQFAGMAMRCIEKEFPNKLDHVMNNEKEVLAPRTLHPAFYGCFDWHSSVHAHWMLIRLLKTFPDLPEAAVIRGALSRNLTAANVLTEVQYLGQADRQSFERTYGWAWFLKLVEELYRWDDPEGKAWLKNLAPLEEAMVERYMAFLPKQTYAIRAGVHPNTAFGIAFALDYARAANNKPMEELLIQRSLFYFSGDRDCPAGWEPGGEDFFSPCLMEADLMQRVLKPQEFIRWFHAFLPGMKAGEIRGLMEPAVVTDRGDGKLVHLDGLNLSRAWCMKRIAAALPKNDGAREYLLRAARVHTEDALKNIHSGQYAGEHWLASFAAYLLTQGK